MTSNRKMSDVSHTHPNEETSKNAQSVFNRGGELTVEPEEEE